MSDLPYLYSECNTPASQPAEPGQSADYIAVYVVQGTEACIAVELTRTFLKFGVVERWHPIFECPVPSELQCGREATEEAESYFQIWFRGIPSEKGRFGRAGFCNREVRILSMSRIMQGRPPPITR